MCQFLPGLRRELELMHLIACLYINSLVLVESQNISNRDMLGDRYFICFENYNMAYVAMLLLNSTRVQLFLKSIAFLDAKRPYTKKVLERIDFGKIIDSLTFNELIKTEQDLNLSRYVALPMYETFKSLLGMGQMRLA